MISIPNRFGESPGNPPPLSLRISVERLSPVVSPPRRMRRGDVHATKATLAPRRMSTARGEGRPLFFLLIWPGLTYLELIISLIYG